MEQLQLLENIFTEGNVEVEDEFVKEQLFGMKIREGYRPFSQMTKNGLHTIGIKAERIDYRNPVIVGLPGFLQDNAHFLPLIKNICENYDIEFFGVSPPSSGQSVEFEKPMSEVIEEDYLRAYRKFLLDIRRRYVILGYSIGGLEGQILTAESARNKVAGLIAMAPVKNRNIARRKFSLTKERKDKEKERIEKEGGKPRDVRVYDPVYDRKSELKELFGKNDAQDIDDPLFNRIDNHLRTKARGSYTRLDSYQRERYGVDPERIKVPLLVFAGREDGGRTTSEYMPINPEEVWEIESHVANRRISIADVFTNPIDDPPVPQISQYDKRVVIDNGTHVSILLGEDVKIVAEKIGENFEKFRIAANY